MSATHVDRHTAAAMEGAATAPLSKAQKSRLCRLARAAFERLRDRGELTAAARFDVWRHAQQETACGQAHLTACTQGDYLRVKAHFHRLLGQGGTADTLERKARMEPRSWARWQLEQECAKAGALLPDAMQYARGFLRNRRGVALEQASENQIWHAIFVVRRRVQQLRRQ